MISAELKNNMGTDSFAKMQGNEKKLMPLQKPLSIDCHISKSS